MKTFWRWLCCVAVCGVILCPAVFGAGKEAAAEGIYSWDFSDCLIRDILYVVSLDTGISIVPDDTVSGKGDFRFTGKDFETAFDSFLNSARLYASKSDEVWTVSRFRLIEQNGLFSLDVCDLTAEQIVEKLSVFMETAVTYEVLPSGMLSMHFKGLNERELLESVCLRLNGFELVENDRGYHLEKKNSVGSIASQSFGYTDIRVIEEEKISVDVKDSKVSDVLESLFACRKETGLDTDTGFCVLANCEGRIIRSCFVAESFDDALERVCEQNGLGIVVAEGMYYLVSDVQAKEKLAYGKKNWYKLALSYTKAEKFVSLLKKRFGELECVVLPDEMSLLVCAGERDYREIEVLKEEVDLKTDTYLIELRFIRPDEFVKHLPPGVDRECLFFADDNSCVYFKGTYAAYLSLCEQVKICDRPVVRVSYDLLILQYDEGSENSWNPGFSTGTAQIGERNGFGVNIGNVLNLNLNVISAFGLDFAAKLQASLEENKTSVFADTTLHGVAGKQINFQNTNTYRYRDNNVDPSTGKPVYSGVTKEIVSGLKLDVVGFVSGDGMITSTVTASVTRQGIDTSASTGNPPPTSEKLVTTEVCGKSGEPIVISGLIQNSTSQGNSGIPLISKLPLLGMLFKHSEKTTEKTQMVIYLVPHIETYSEETDKEENAFKLSWIQKYCDILSGKICEKRITFLEVHNEEL